MVHQGDEKAVVADRSPTVDEIRDELERLFGEDAKLRINRYSSNVDVRVLPVEAKRTLEDRFPGWEVTLYSGLKLTLVENGAGENTSDTATDDGEKR